MRWTITRIIYSYVLISISTFTKYKIFKSIIHVLAQHTDILQNCFPEFYFWEELWLILAPLAVCDRIMTTFILQTHPENIRAHPRIKPKVHTKDLFLRNSDSPNHFWQSVTDLWQNAFSRLIQRTFGLIGLIQALWNQKYIRKIISQELGFILVPPILFCNFIFIIILSLFNWYYYLLSIHNAFHICINFNLSSYAFGIVMCPG